MPVLWEDIPVVNALPARKILNHKRMILLFALPAERRIIEAVGRKKAVHASIQLYMLLAEAGNLLKTHIEHLPGALPALHVVI